MTSDTSLEQPYPRPLSGEVVEQLPYPMDDLGYRRMHWRCNSLNEKSHQTAPAWFSL